MWAFWGRHIWAHGYIVAGSGNVTDEVIIKYIEEQGKEPPGGDFKINDLNFNRLIAEQQCYRS